MEKYTTPQLEIVEIDKEDMVLTSGCMGIYTCAVDYTPIED